MTAFKQFPLEDEDKDFSAFKKNAKIMLGNNILLYRGTGAQKEHFDFDPNHTGFIAAARTIERRAKAAMRISDSWEIPNRKLSYFVTRDGARHHNPEDMHQILQAILDN